MNWWRPCTPCGCAWRDRNAAFDIADTRAIVHLTTIAAFGDAILGKRLRRAPDSAEEIARRQWFENWFGEFLNVYMSRKG